MKNIIDEINRRHENLTRSQEMITDFLLENYALVPFETLNEIAHRVGLSTTSLIRFSRTMGYKGYTDLKKSIQDLIKVKVSLPSRFDGLSEQGGTPNDLLLRCRDIAVDNVETTLGLQDTGKLDLAVDWISSANHNYMLGLGTCFSPAFYLAAVLSQIKKKVRLIQGVASTCPKKITNMEGGDVYTIFSFPRFYRETVDIAHSVRRKRAEIIVITSKDIRPVKPYEDITVPYSAVGPSFKGSYVATHFFIGYIISGIAAENKGEEIEVVSKIEEILGQNYFIGF